MKFMKKTLSSAMLAACLLFLPVMETATASNPETGLAIAAPVSGQSAQAAAPSPETHPSATATLQEEAQYLTASQLAVKERLLAVLWVYRSAEYRGLCYQAYNLARMEVDRALAQRKQEEKTAASHHSPGDGTGNPSRPLAVILDIDETVASNVLFETYYLEHPDIKADYRAWEKWLAQGRDLLPGAKDFLKYADSRGIQIFYITGRGPQDRDVTLSFLRKTGLPLPNAAHLRMNDRSGSKMNHFSALAQRYDIVCYIGDNAGDFPIGAIRRENKIIKKTQHTPSSAVKTKQDLPLDITAMLKQDQNNARNAQVDANRKLFGTKFILLPNPMYGDWEYNLAENYRRLPPEQQIALRKAALKKIRL